MGTAAPKPVAAGLDTPKVRPAEGLMPVLLKLKPELPPLPKPRRTREQERGAEAKREYKKGQKKQE